MRGAMRCERRCMLNTKRRCDAMQKSWRCALSLQKSSAMRSHDAETLAMRCRDAGHSGNLRHCYDYFSVNCADVGPWGLIIVADVCHQQNCHHSSNSRSCLWMHHSFSYGDVIFSGCSMFVCSVNKNLFCFSSVVCPSPSVYLLAR